VAGRDQKGKQCDSQQSLWLSEGCPHRVSKGSKQRLHFSRAFASCFASPGGGQPGIPYLKHAGFFDSDEELAFSSAYGFLCSGSHPGVGGEQQAYLAMVLSLTFGHVALSKFAAWKAHSYKTF
jgi:hypothetical protein